MKRILLTFSLLISTVFSIWSAVYSKNVKFSETFKSGNTTYTVLWVCDKFNLKLNYKDKYDSKDEDNIITDIYIIPNMIKEDRQGSIWYSMSGDYAKPTINGYRMWTTSHESPRLWKIVLHEPKGQESFVGAIVMCDFLSEKSKGSSLGEHVTWEIRLPDEVANRMMDLVKERTKFRVIEGSSLDKIFWGANMIYSTSTTLQGYQLLK